MFKSVILPIAKQDIREAAQWYNEREPGLGKRFTDQVRKTVHYIRQNPTAVASLGLDGLKNLRTKSNRVEMPTPMHSAAPSPAKS